MKLVKERIILEKFTDDNSDPIFDIGIGMRHKIKEWINEMNTLFNKKLIVNPHITKDLKIDADEVDLSLDKLTYLPDYIKFGIIKDHFYCNLYPKISLKHMPDEIFGDMRIYCSYQPQEYTDEELRKICKIHGTITWSTF